MKLSMHILADWLKEYAPKILISDGGRDLRNVRFLSPDIKMESIDVYVGKLSDDFGEKVVCVHKHDMIALQTEDIEEVFNKILDAFDYYNNWAEDMENTIRHGGGLEEILCKSEELFKGALMVSDPGYYLVATHNIKMLEGNRNYSDMVSDGIMPMDSIQAVNKDPRIRKNSRFSYVMDYRALEAKSLCRNLFVKNKHIGWLLYASKEGEELNTCMMQLLDVLGDMIELWSDLNEDQMQLVSYSEILQGLMSGQERSVASVEARLVTLGWYPKDPKEVFCVSGGKGDPSVMKYLRRKLELSAKGVLTLDSERSTLILVNKAVASARDIRSLLSDFLNEIQACGGVSPVFSDISELKAMAGMAEAAAEFGDRNTGIFSVFSECAVPYAMDVLKRNVYKGFSHPALLILKEYDRKNHTDLLNTLEVYLTCERNYVRTAERLFIHRNSLLYRLKRIEELTDIDLEDPDVRLYLILSLRIGICEDEA